MFSDRFGLTDAVRDGRKKMTRRRAYDGEIKDIHTGYITEGVDAGRLALCDGNMIVAKSKYKLGEVVAVAQRYCEVWNDPFVSEQCLADEQEPDFLRYEKGWNNKMFVKAAYMPHRIRITDIKVERLQDISDEDCLKEGIYVSDTFTKYGLHNGYSPQCANDPKEKKRWFHSPKEAFAALIDKVSGKGTWERNDWQFAYTFKLIK